MTAEQDQQLQEQVDQEVQEAIDFAEQSPSPEIDTMFDYMYATPVANAIDPQWEQFKHSKEAK